MKLADKVLAAKQSGSVRFNFSGGLKKFPVELFDLADTLEILDLSGNELSLLPDDFHRLHKLRILFCSDNRFTDLPAVLGQCPQLGMVGFKSNRIRSVPGAALGKSLRWLILTDNQVSELPAEMGQCTHLQKLMLAGNQLAALPDEMASCTRLELLRIAANRFSHLPEWLFELPRLAWLAYAGNPFSQSHEADRLRGNQIDEIHWRQLNMQQKLGEGASGVIHQAMWNRGGDESIEVAVKMFKGAITSDGLPHSEKAACISAGKHPNLIPVHGKVIGHPADQTGLIMSRVDRDFRNLAGPPSLESCTRDIYPDDTQFTLGAVLKIAHGIASAARQLHENGILHGDLYAHNILHNLAGDCLLGDFGAASFYDPSDPRRADALQRIEVRAFGCLLEELLERCEANDQDQDVIHSLVTLQKNCAQANNAARPQFAEILSVLEAARQRAGCESGSQNA